MKCIGHSWQGLAYFEGVTDLSQEICSIPSHSLIIRLFTKIKCPDFPWQQFRPKILVLTAMVRKTKLLPFPSQRLTVFWGEIQSSLSLPLLRMNLPPSSLANQAFWTLDQFPCLPFNTQPTPAQLWSTLGKSKCCCLLDYCICHRGKSAAHTLNVPFL